jgi:hypothetical protein
MSLDEASAALADLMYRRDVDIDFHLHLDDPPYRKVSAEVVDRGTGQTRKFRAARLEWLIPHILRWGR